MSEANHKLQSSAGNLAMKTPEQMAEEWANGEGDLWFADISTYTDGHKSAVKQAYLAGYKAAINSYGPVKECSCNIKPSEPHRITHKIRQMVDEVTQSHIDEPSRSYVDIANLEAILKYVAEDEV